MRLWDRRSFSLLKVVSRIQLLVSVGKLRTTTSNQDSAQNGLSSGMLAERGLPITSQWTTTNFILAATNNREETICQAIGDVIVSSEAPVGANASVLAPVALVSN